MASPKKFTVEVTLNELVNLRDLIKARYADLSYSARYDDEECYDDVDVDEGGVTTVTRKLNWKGSSRKSAIAERDKLNALHYALTGDNINDD